MSLTTKIIIGFILGLVAGLFFGELVEPITIVGEVFIMLLQMPVLPYVFLSLIIGIGGFKIEQGKQLVINLGILIVVLWSLSLIAVGLMPLTFPDWETASFFSTAQVKETEPIDFLALYIPSNPFNALSNTVVPAVVLFSIILGVALSTLPQRDVVIKVLNPIVEALGKITNWVVEFAPYGVFALVAGLSGTLDPEVLSKLWIFLLSYGAMALLLSFWILPGLVTALTPLTYHQVIRESKDALVTAFATGNLFVVLPLLAEKSKQALKEHQINGDEEVDVIVPTAFSFPSSGKLLTLSFILFAGWLSGFDVSISEYPAFMLAGTFSFFGSTVTAIPFMLDLMQIPSDLFNLFLPIDNIITNRFGALTAAVFILSLTYLGVTSTTGKLRFQPQKFLRYIGISIIMFAVTIVGLRYVLGLLEGAYTSDKELVEMYLSRHSVPNEVYLDSIPPHTDYDPSKTRLENIVRRGYIRIGFLKDHLPNAFINKNGQLVGSDIEMAHILAKDLGVSIKFIRVEQENIPKHLDIGEIDILMTGTAVTLIKLGQIAYTVPYEDANFAFIVHDYRRSKFKDINRVRAMDSVRIGVYHDLYYTSKIQELLPDAKIIPLESPRQFFQGSIYLDALAFTAERGGAWSIIYPEYSVVVPSTESFKIPMAYIVSVNDQEFLNFINTWIYLKKANATFDSAFSYWVMGKGIQEVKDPRWSVIRNVFHWAD